MPTPIYFLKIFDNEFTTAYHNLKMMDGRKPDDILDLIALCEQIKDMIKILIEKHSYEDGGYWRGRKQDRNT
ncbi:MAG: hypothetical protein WC375_07520 [Methanomassiliicoccales archaeon]|jgi:hypothetical protein